MEEKEDGRTDVRTMKEGVCDRIRQRGQDGTKRKGKKEKQCNREMTIVREVGA